MKKIRTVRQTVLFNLLNGVLKLGDRIEKLGACDMIMLIKKYFMEKEIKIKTTGGKYVYGRWRGKLNQPLIVFVHGLTGNMDEHIFYNGARFFEKHGFASFRFNLYDDEDDARKLHQCDLKTHAADLNRVIEYFRRKGVEKNYAVGHSYGGATILFSKTNNFSGIVLWDPTMDPDIVYRKTIRDKVANGFIREWSFKFILGKKMVNEAKAVSDFSGAAKKNQSPVKIILAGEGNAQSKRKFQFFKSLNEPKETVVIKKAGHTFSEDKAETALFAETLKWLKKYCIKN